MWMPRRNHRAGAAHAAHARLYDAEEPEPGERDERRLAHRHSSEVRAEDSVVQRGGDGPAEIAEALTVEQRGAAKATLVLWVEVAGGCYRLLRTLAPLGITTQK